MQKLRLSGLQGWPRLACSDSTTIDEGTSHRKASACPPVPRGLSSIGGARQKDASLHYVRLSLSPAPVARGRSLHEGQLVTQATLPLTPCRSLREIVTRLVGSRVSVHRVALMPCSLPRGCRRRSQPRDQLDAGPRPSLMKSAK